MKPATIAAAIIMKYDVTVGVVEEKIESNII